MRSKVSMHTEYGGYYRMRLIAILSPTDKWGDKN